MALALKLRTICSHTLVPCFVPADGIVIDVGANIGAFSVSMATEYHCQCFAIEPSPETFEKIPADNRLRKYCLAIAGSPGEVDLHIGEGSESTTLHRAGGERFLATIRMPARALDEFCRSTGIDRIDVLKMDIEGEELAVLNSCGDDFLRSVGQVTVEFHEWNGQGTVADVRGIIRRMRSLGFWAFNIGRTTYCDVLFVNRRYMSRASFAATWMSHWTPRVIQSLLRRLGVRRRNSA